MSQLINWYRSKIRFYFVAQYRERKRTSNRIRTS